VVEWKNTDTVAHNVTFSDDPNVSIGNMNPGDSWEVKFTTAGAYNYQCTFHAGMTGTVTVS
jgi:plastocyanin